MNSDQNRIGAQTDTQWTCSHNFGGGNLWHTMKLFHQNHKKKDDGEIPSEKEELLTKCTDIKGQILSMWRTDVLCQSNAQQDKQQVQMGSINGNDNDNNYVHLVAGSAMKIANDCDNIEPLQTWQNDITELATMKSFAIPQERPKDQLNITCQPNKMCLL